MSIQLEHPSVDNSAREVGGGDVALLEHPVEAADPFDFNIEFIQNAPASENALMCGTGDTCGSTCGSACTTS